MVEIEMRFYQMNNFMWAHLRHWKIKFNYWLINILIKIINFKGGGGYGASQGGGYGGGGKGGGGGGYGGGGGKFVE